jgi:hypothetical protein
MQTITVSAKGDKTYSIMKDIPRPTKATRERDSAKAKYGFNDMVDNDFMYVATKEDRAAVTQAFKSKVYADAAKRGYLFTRDLAKCDKVTQAAVGQVTGFGIWFTAYTPEELVANAEKEKA